jgi:hypothetical protein
MIDLETLIADEIGRQADAVPDLQGDPVAVRRSGHRRRIRRTAGNVAATMVVVSALTISMVASFGGFGQDQQDLASSSDGALGTLPTLGIGLPGWSVTGAYETNDGGGFRFISYQLDGTLTTAELSIHGIPLGSDREDEVLWVAASTPAGVVDVALADRNARMRSEPPDTAFVWREDDNTTVYLYVGIGTNDSSGVATALAVAESVTGISRLEWAQYLADFPNTPVTTTTTP